MMAMMMTWPIVMVKYTYVSHPYTELIMAAITCVYSKIIFTGPTRTTSWIKMTYMFQSGKSIQTNSQTILNCVALIFLNEKSITKNYKIVDYMYITSHITFT